VVRFRRHAAIPEGPGPVWEPGDENTYVEDQVKRRTTAPDEIQARFAHHCYWEELIPSPVRFFIRDRDYELVHQGLTQALFRRKVYWTHQLESQLVETTTLGDKEPPASLESQERTDAVVPIQGSVGGTVQARRRPGPKTPPEITMAVQRIVEKTLPDLPLIKKLEQVSEVMDSSTDPVIPIPGLWLRRSPPLRTWSDAAAIEPNVAMKAITGRLKPRAKPDSAN
jgi:hypothetical protein